MGQPARRKPVTIIGIQSIDNVSNKIDCVVELRIVVTAIRTHLRQPANDVGVARAQHGSKTMSTVRSGQGIEADLVTIQRCQSFPALDATPATTFIEDATSATLGNVRRRRFFGRIETQVVSGLEFSQ